MGGQPGEHAAQMKQTDSSAALGYDDVNPTDAPLACERVQFLPTKAAEIFWATWVRPNPHREVSSVLI